MEKYSYSKVASYLECPRKYWYSYVEKRLVYPSSRMLLGSLLHQSLEEFLTPYILGGQTDLFTQSTTYNLERLLTIASSRTKLPGYSDLDQAEIKEICTKLWGHMPKVPPQIYSLEQACSLQGSSWVLKGRVDRIDKEADGLHIIDYKTGGLGLLQERYPFLQLLLYAASLENVYKVSYRVLRTGELHSMKVSKQKIEEAIATVEQTHEAIEAEHFEATPTEKTCTHCSHKKICPSAVRTTHS